MGLFFVGLLIFAGILALLVLLGRFAPGGTGLTNWDPAGHMERQAEADLEDMQEMLELENARRRARGLPDLDELDLMRRTGG